MVFLTGWEDGIFPHQRSLGDDVELAEERRLAYVGITRAKQRLYVSRAMMRSAWGQPGANPASRFLDDIPRGSDRLAAHRRDARSGGFIGDSSFEGRTSPTVEGLRRPRRARQLRRRLVDLRRAVGTGHAPAGSASGLAVTGRRPSARLGTGPVLELAVGNRVSHDKYGLGTVVAVDGVGQRATATIDFGDDRQGAADAHRRRADDQALSCFRRSAAAGTIVTGKGFSSADSSVAGGLADGDVAAVDELERGDRRSPPGRRSSSWRRRSPRTWSA